MSVLPRVGNISALNKMENVLQERCVRYSVATADAYDMY